MTYSAWRSSILRREAIYTTGRVAEPAMDPERRFPLTTEDRAYLRQVDAAFQEGV